MKNKIGKAWEKRSKTFGASKKAVMNQACPSFLNQHIHKIHLREILAVLPNKKYLCLDAGCGYGRIASELILQRPKLFIYGIDISKTFVELFNQRMKNKGKAITGDIRNLPFSEEKFDFVWVVVVLNYLQKKAWQEKAVKEIFRVLKPGGKAVFIEPNELGGNLSSLWGFLPFLYRRILGRRKTKVETISFPLPWGRIEELIGKAGGEIIKKRGFPFLTLFLPSLLFLGKISPSLTVFFADIIKKLDKKMSFSRFSYVIFYQAEKNR